VNSSPTYILPLCSSAFEFFSSFNFSYKFGHTASMADICAAVINDKSLILSPLSL